MKKVLAVAVAGLAMVAGSAQAIIIDTFNDTTTSLVPPFFGPNSGLGPVTTASSNPGNEMVGDFRTMSITAFSNANGQGLTFEADGGNTPNELAFSANAGVSGSGAVLWGGANGTGGLGGVDITDGGINDALQLDFTGIDQGGVTLTFSITDGDGDVATRALTANIGQNAFLFNSFTNIGAVNLMDVDFLELSIDVSVASDMTLDLVQTRQGEIPDPNDAPLPATLVLLGLGAVAAARARRAK